MNGSDPPWVRDLRNKVRARLRAQGATQAGLARHLGVTEKHVSQLLTGKAGGTPEMLDRLARSVGLRITLADTGPAPALPGRRTSPRGKPGEADDPWEAPDGTRWLHFPGPGEWTGWRPGEDGVWVLAEAEFRREYPDRG